MSIVGCQKRRTIASTWPVETITGSLKVDRGLLESRANSPLLTGGEPLPELHRVT